MAIPVYLVQRTCNKYISRTRVENRVRVVPELGPQIRWSRDEPWAGALHSMGDHSESLVEVKQNTTRRLLCSMMFGNRSKRRTPAIKSWCRDQDQWRS